MNSYKTITLLLKITSLLLIKITPFSYYVIFVLLGEHTRGTRVTRAGQYTRGSNYRAPRDHRVGMACGVGAWGWRGGLARGHHGGLARGYGAPRGRRVGLARVFGAPRGRRVEMVPVYRAITTNIHI